MRIARGRHSSGLAAAADSVSVVVFGALAAGPAAGALATCGTPRYGKVDR
jgi:hypothetical protein